ncbi:MAG: NAD(P)H-binding protein [Nitrosopumilaceae archaeon]|nr:NAD(P)H-binding protein [Nitrosopumilaceae archaeon]
MQTMTNAEKIAPYSILITGATGFIGSRLISAFDNMGIKVKAMTRKDIPETENVKYVKADAFKVEQLEKAMEGIETAYYLLHSMEGSKEKWEDFANREKQQAQNFLKAATAAGVKRIIYLGGLVNDSLELSNHMESRKNVGEILASGNIPVTELRASLIIGAEGGSYAMLQYLVERLRIMVCPKWVKSLAQPIAVDDVIDYLVGCATHPETSGKILEIGGPEKMTYEQIMREYSSYIKKSLFVIEIPFLTTRLSSYWVDLITPVKASLARPLIDSLVHDTVVTDDTITKIIPLKLKTVRKSIDIATKEMSKKEPVKRLVEEKIGFKTNQKILMIALLGMAVLGSSYYWLDNRSDVYQPIWITLSALWFVTIGASIIFVQNKTRLGYLLGGMLGWTTLAFWLFDNFHVAFQMSIIAEQPSDIMTIRNFVGIMIVAIAIVASHNTFHKVRKYQDRGLPLPI